MMQDQNELMLSWHSFLGGGSDIVTGLCAQKGGQYSHYDLMPLDIPVSILDSKPKISGNPLMLNSRMGYRACHLPCFVLS